jgi:hypothetical protein
MWDIFYLAVALAFFVTAAKFIRGLERLKRSEHHD